MKRLLIVLAFAVAARAQTSDVINADRPGLADSSATVGQRAFQIEFGVQRDDDDADESWSTPTLLRYGLTQSFELRLETSGYEDDSWGPLSIGFKKHFGDTPYGLIGSWTPEEDAASLRLAADIELNEKWALNPNVGIAHEDGSTSGLAALTVQYNINDKLNVFVDGALQTPDSLILDAGVAWIIGTRTQLDFSVGYGVHGDRVPERFWSAGISRAF